MLTRHFGFQPFLTVYCLSVPFPANSPRNPSSRLSPSPPGDGGAEGRLAPGLPPPPVSIEQCPFQGRQEVIPRLFLEAEGGGWDLLLGFFFTRGLCTL